MVSKVRNVRLGVFSGGGCHHPNIDNDFLDGRCASRISSKFSPAPENA